MGSMLPPELMEYRDRLPMLKEVLKADLLRCWPLSKVWRLRLQSGETIIAKRGKDSMASEGEIYKNLLSRLNAVRPQVYDSYNEPHCSILLMEDLGTVTLEKDPGRENYASAARMLAEIRLSSQKQISSGRLLTSEFHKFVQPEDRVIKDLQKILVDLDVSKEDSRILQEAIKRLPYELNRLFRECCLALTHNDYNAKNLMVQQNKIIPVDWSNATLSPHLGDLYCLIQEAGKNEIERSFIVDAFQERFCTDTIDWQIHIGGVCWLIRGLCWVCEEGITKVPGTENWVAPLVEGISRCMKQMG